MCMRAPSLSSTHPNVAWRHSNRGRHGDVTSHSSSSPRYQLSRCLLTIRLTPSLGGRTYDIYWPCINRCHSSPRHHVAITGRHANMIYRETERESVRGEYTDIGSGLLPQTFQSQLRLMLFPPLFAAARSANSRSPERVTCTSIIVGPLASLSIDLRTCRCGGGSRGGVLDPSFPKHRDVRRREREREREKEVGLIGVSKRWFRGRRCCKQDRLSTV